MLIAFALRMQLARRTCSLSVGHGEPLALPVFPTQVAPGERLSLLYPLEIYRAAVRTGCGLLLGREACGSSLL